MHTEYSTTKYVADQKPGQRGERGVQLIYCIAEITRVVSGKLHRLTDVVGVLAAYYLYIEMHTRWRADCWAMTRARASVRACVRVLWCLVRASGTGRRTRCPRVTSQRVWG